MKKLEWEADLWLCFVLQEYVCGDKGVKCVWGHALNVANRYVYATQPDRDRILIISKVQMVVVDVREFLFQNGSV